MCDCRKCGAKKVTRRKAGVFFCQHCGMQPGQNNMDRSGTVFIPKSSKIKAPQYAAS